MKVGGVEVSGPAMEFLVLPRPGAKDLVFQARAVMDMDEFDRLVPEPTPSRRLEKGGWKQNLDDPDYIKAITDRAELKFAYLVVKSLEPSDIEWETVQLTNPSTWTNWSDEMKKAGLNQTEINRISNCVASANSLDEGKLEMARQSFLRGLEKASSKSTGPSTEPQNTPSGEPAKDLGPDHQE